MSNIEIIAHRGFSGAAPENTLAALSAALDAGADSVEFDVQIASCGTPILFHDSHLGRTTNGAGPPGRRTLAQLKVLDAGSWFGSDFAGERIPTLAEALELCGDSFQRIYLEIKSYRELHDIDRIIDLTRAAGVTDRTAFISLDWTPLERVATQCPDGLIGYVVDSRDRLDDALELAGRKNSALIDLNHTLVLEDPDLPEKISNAGHDQAVWTVNEVADAEAIVKAGIYRLTTNQVTDLIEWRAGR